MKPYHKAIGTYCICFSYWTHDFFWGKFNSSERCWDKFINHCCCPLLFYSNTNKKLLYNLLQFFAKKHIIFYLLHASKFKMNAPQLKLYQALKIVLIYIITLSWRIISCTEFFNLTKSFLNPNSVSCFQLNKA